MNYIGPVWLCLWLFMKSVIYRIDFLQLLLLLLLLLLILCSTHRTPGRDRWKERSECVAAAGRRIVVVVVVVVVVVFRSGVHLRIHEGRTAGAG